MNYGHVITQHGKPIAIITSWIEDTIELRYLQYHGEGYEISGHILIEDKAGDYARGDQGEGPDESLPEQLSMVGLMTQRTT